MKRCGSCNYECEDYRTVCPRCGKPLGGNASVRPGGNTQRPVVGRVQPGPSPAAHRGMAYGYIMPHDHTMEFTSEEITMGKPFAMVNYLFGWIGILICLIYRSNNYVRFHVRENVKYIIICLLSDTALSFLGVMFMLLGYIAEGNYIIAGNAWGPNEVLARISLFFFALIFLVHFVIKIFQIICFVRVGMGKALEAPFVRKFNFMR